MATEKYLQSIQSNRGRSLRRAMALANVNAFLWAIGNGLVSTLLIIYLAQHLGAQGFAISWILAAPRLAGVLRLVTPALFASGIDRKTCCVGGYVASGLLLLLIPLTVTPENWMELNLSGGEAIALLVSLWCAYHLLEFIATVALWSWLGDWMPDRVRATLIGRRERWLTAGRVAGYGASISLAAIWWYLDPDAPGWRPLAWSALIGSAVLVVSVVPLSFLSRLDGRPSAHPKAPWKSLSRAFTDPGYARLLLYSCWLAVANGISASAQSMYPVRVLGIRYEQMVVLRSMMYGGQSLLAPLVGRWFNLADPRRWMIAAQVVVATGPLFFFIATPGMRWWVVGAYIAWVAYAVLNVGLDELKLRLAPSDNNAPSLAAYYVVSDLANAVTVLIAGTWYDMLRKGDEPALQLFALLFVVSFAARLSAAVPIYFLRTDRANA